MHRHKTLIIAEAGVNHNGDINLAKQLIEVAAFSGADVVKFQSFDADSLVTKAASKAAYQYSGTSAEESQHAMLTRLELSAEMHKVLLEHCLRHQITFLSTGFDIKSVDMLSDMGVSTIKVPSGEITNLPYLRHIGNLKKSVILSSGMSVLGEIEAAIDVLEGAGTSRNNITILHCSSEYPTAMSDVNLRAMQSIRSAFGVQVGYSDHTVGIEVAIAAVCLGASVIEKHFTLNRSLPGPDHQASLEPEELKSMVTAIRNIEKALGDGIKRPSAGEIKNKLIVRKSLVAACVIRAGETFTEKNLTAKRPGFGISPMCFDHVVGRVASRDFEIDELISI